MTSVSFPHLKYLSCYLPLALSFTDTWHSFFSPFSFSFFTLRRTLKGPQDRPLHIGRYQLPQYTVISFCKIRWWWYSNTIPHVGYISPVSTKQHLYLSCQRPSFDHFWGSPCLQLILSFILLNLSPIALQHILLFLSSCPWECHQVVFSFASCLTSCSFNLPLHYTWCPYILFSLSFLTENE